MQDQKSKGKVNGYKSPKPPDLIPKHIYFLNHVKKMDKGYITFIFNMES